VTMSDVSATASSDAPSTTASKKKVYTGHRLGTGSQLPNGTRVACLRNLLKMVTHKFQCRDHDLSHRERLIISGVKLPIAPTFVVSRMPGDRESARARLIEGPVLAVCSRGETRFDAKPRRGRIVGEEGATSEVWDLSREVGCALAVAGMRNRQGSKERSTEDAEAKWWESVPRWGGGDTKWGMLACEVYEDEDPSWSPAERLLQEEKRRKDEEMRERTPDPGADARGIDVDDLIAGLDGRPKKKAKGGGFEPGRSSRDEGKPGNGKGGKKEEIRDGRRVMFMPPQKRKWYAEWAKMKPMTPIWDEKVIWKKIGAERRDAEDSEAGGSEAVGPAPRPQQQDGHVDAEWDDIYTLSAVNHHVSLVKLRVSKQYLDWLEAGGETVESRTQPEHSKSNAHRGQDEQRREGGRRGGGGEEKQKQPADNNSAAAAAAAADDTSSSSSPSSDPSILSISRSKWIDLFDVEERKEFLVALWRVFCWLNRERITPDQNRNQ